MNKPLRRLEDMPVAEQTKVLTDIKAYLLKIIYTEVLPKQSLSEQIETLKMLERIENGDKQSTSTADDTFLSDVMSQLNEVLS